METFQVNISAISASTPGSGNGFSEDKPLAIPLQPVTLTVDVTAVDEDGVIYEDFDRPVSLRVTPGELSEVTDDNGEASNYYQVQLTKGKGSFKVSVVNVFGPVYLWVQDSTPLKKASAEAPAESADESGNTSVGFTQPDYETDTLCDETLAASDKARYLECSTYAALRTNAAGVSNPIYFMNPDVVQLQRMEETDKSDCSKGIMYDGTNQCEILNQTSAFKANFVTINAREPLNCLVVTAITNEGFYVTDLSAHRAENPTDGSTPDKSYRLGMLPYTEALSHYGHLFIYNFSYPDDLLIGDCIESVTGTVQEFSGTTQLVFPSWVKNSQYKNDPALIPEPYALEFDAARMAGASADSVTKETASTEEDTRSSGYRLCMAYSERTTKYACKEKEALPCASSGYLDNRHLQFVHCAHNWRNFDTESLESSLIKFTNVIPANEFINCDSNGNSEIGFFNYFKKEGEEAYAWNCSDGYNEEDAVDCECYINCSVGYDPENPERRDRYCSELNSFESYGQWTIVLEEQLRSRINIQTSSSIPRLDPTFFDRFQTEGNVGYPDCRLDVTGILRQTQAARPRWIIMPRDSKDVCISSAPGTCPAVLRDAYEGADVETKAILRYCSELTH